MEYERGGDHHSFMLLGDEKGVTVEGSLNYDISLPNDMQLNESSWVEIVNFKIKHAGGLVRTTKNKYTIKFTEETLVSMIEPINGSYFLRCANFRGIKRGLYHPMYCVDLCGALVRVGDLISHEQAEPANIYNQIVYSLDFSLIDLSYKHIKCVASGALAHSLNGFWRSTTADIVVCVLRLWRIEWGAGGFKYVTNFEGGSEILFDIDIPDIRFFKLQ
ncbi:hypothetical protein Rs2_29067 [Raphanus sativus]|nr:hypothetical protein Rs2_29067 [Raphanus sativus]